MATLTITVPDAAVTRIRAAFGVGGTPATVQQVQDQVRDLIKAKVIAVEASAAQATDLATRNAEIWP